MVLPTRVAAICLTAVGTLTLVALMHGGPASHAAVVAAPSREQAEAVLHDAMAFVRSGNQGDVCTTAVYAESCRGKFIDGSVPTLTDLGEPVVLGSRVAGDYRVLELCGVSAGTKYVSDYPVLIVDGQHRAELPIFWAGDKWSLNPDNPVARSQATLDGGVCV